MARKKRKNPAEIMAKWKNMGFATSYAHRDEMLRLIGFDSYREYLASDLWSSIRKRVLDKDKWRCQVCGMPRSGVVHHIHYTKSNLRGRNLNHMVVLCRGCHRRIEFYRGRKSTLFESSMISLSRVKKGKAKVRQAIADERKIKQHWVTAEEPDYTTLIFGDLA